MTLGLAVGRQFPLPEVLGYWVARVIGGVAAVAVVGTVFSSAPEEALVNHPVLSASDIQAFILEIIATAMLLVVISAVATDVRPPWNGVFAAVAIGGFIITAATVVRPFTSGSFNPGPLARPGDPRRRRPRPVDLPRRPAVGGVLGGLIYLLVRRNPGAMTEGREMTD